MSWDDEDFEISENLDIDDEELEELEDNDLVAESWDALGEEDDDDTTKTNKSATKEKKTIVSKKKGSVKNKILEKEQKRLEELKKQKEAKLRGDFLESNDQDDDDNDDNDNNDDDKIKKVQAQIDADLENAADLFGQTSISDDKDKKDSISTEKPTTKPTVAKTIRIGGKSNPTIKIGSNDTKTTNTNNNNINNEKVTISQVEVLNPRTKKQFDVLKKELGVHFINNLAQFSYYSPFAIDFVKVLCEPLTADQTRKVVSSLNSIINEKTKEEKLAAVRARREGNSKSKNNQAKASLSGASAKFNDDTDVTNYGDNLDDDIDFM